MANMDILGKPSDDNEFLYIDGLGGQLYLTKTLMYYDLPLLFICQNNDGDIYLFNELKEEHDRLEWGVVKVTPEIIEQFYNGEISFKELYLSCGDDYLIVGATYGKGNYFDSPLEIYVDNDKDAYDSYSELIEFYNDNQKFNNHLYDNIGESND